MLIVQVSLRVSKNLWMSWQVESHGYRNMSGELRNCSISSVPTCSANSSNAFKLSSRRHFAWTPNPGNGSGNYQSISTGLAHVSHP